jgi:hypothetical protein
MGGWLLLCVLLRFWWSSLTLLGRFWEQNMNEMLFIRLLGCASAKWAHSCAAMWVLVLIFNLLTIAG